jgi:uncharacterized protein (DUF305 family)
MRNLILLACLAAIVAPVASADAATRYNKTDAAFAAIMLPHHGTGVALANLAAVKATDAQVRGLATHIGKEQRHEIKTLRHLVHRFKTRQATTRETTRRNEIELRGLKAASGVAFDRMWLDVISRHHMAAIQLAQVEVRGGRNAQARRLARKIVRSERAELSELNAFSDRLGG